MKLIRGHLRLTRRLEQSIITLGNFDGFHRGHQQLLAAVREQAHRRNIPAAVIIFEPQPQEFLNPKHLQPRLMRFHEKWRFLAEQSIDYLVCLEFNLPLAQCAADDFVRDILIAQLGMRAIVVGDDCRFGAGRRGDVELLQQLGQQYDFETQVIPPLWIEGERVSSTRVRQALQAGDCRLANALLGSPYFLCGRVVHGDARGRAWGFPTANIYLKTRPVAVAGIYVVQVQGLDSRPLPAVASVGMRPMFASRPLLEVHLLDFDRDIYGCMIKVEFLHKLRDEQVFSSTEQLIAQIRQDIQESRYWFSDSR